MIISADAPSEICVAYRPIFIYGEDNGASGVCEVMYCDVYFDGVFYKTVSSYSPFTVLGGGATLYRFDIQALAQEYIQTQVYDITKINFDEVYRSPIVKNGMAICACYIRTSVTDAYGRVTPQTPLPIQGTIDSAPAAGGGTVCTPSTFNIINATLQATDIQLIEQQLARTRVNVQSFSGGTPSTLDSRYRVYPLTYASKLKFYATDWGRYPFFCKDFLGYSAAPAAWGLVMLSSTGAVVHNDYVNTSVTLLGSSIYTLPIGLKNLRNYFAGVGRPITQAMVDQTEWYYVYMQCYGTGSAPVTGDTALITPRIYIQHNETISPAYTPVPAFGSTAQFVPKHTRIWFRNYLGQLEALNFTERTEAIKVTSTPKEKPLTEGGTENTNFVFSQSLGRSNVRSNEYSIATGLFNEEDMVIIKQLQGCSLAFIEFTSPVPIGGATTPEAKLMPIVILDDQVDTLVWDDRFEYRVSIKYMNSNENILHR